jgi:putative heme-binding domain-containing protein
MPAFSLGQHDLNAIVEFVSALRAPAAEHPASGDAEAGERFFFDKGNCSICHMVRGRGGILGSDLSNLGQERRLGQIEQALRDLSALRTPGCRLIAVRSRHGHTIRGLAKNESNYGLQVESLDGALHFLTQEQIAEEIREPKPLMPPLNAPDEEKRDLLAFVTRLTTGGPCSAFRATPPVGVGITFADIVDPKPVTWPTYHGHLSANRHSSLREINTVNVARVAPRWMFPISNAGWLEVTPMVVDDVMYVTAADEAYALDARSGRQIWHYSRPLTKGVIGDAASAINRGVAILGDRISMVTDQAHLIAPHRSSGQLLWDTEMADYRQHYGATSAPLVVKNLVISGTSGGDEGAPGLIAAYKASTGERVLRFWTACRVSFFWARNRRCKQLRPARRLWGGKLDGNG